MIELIRSLRSLILGETWTIPVGVAATVVIAMVLRRVLSDDVWDEIGGFVLAVMVAVTFLGSIVNSR